ncbi:MAG: hypothetical protein HKN87_17260 [Saprospiraceae bacterium]|nr:hypothetical protein [Saprospiraceae bacterium]
MRGLLAILVIVGVGFVLSSMFSWLSGFLAVFLAVPVFALSKSQSIIYGAIGMFLLWLGYAMLIDFQNEHLLSNQIGTLLGHLPVSALLVITGLMGSIGGALVGWIAGLLTGFIYR